jgi:hypothetical protein
LEACFIFRRVKNAVTKTAIIQTNTPTASPITAFLESPELGGEIGVFSGDFISAVLVVDSAGTLVTIGVMEAVPVLGAKYVWIVSVSVTGTPSLIAVVVIVISKLVVVFG